MSRKFFGIDIKQDTVSAVLIQSGMKGIEITAHALVPLTDFPESQDRVAAALKSITAGMNIADALCLVSFPADRVSFRNLSVPFRETKKIKQVLPFELEPSLPIPIDEAVIDFCMLDLPQPAGMTGLLAAAMTKSAVADIRAGLSAAGIEAHTLSVSGQHTAHCLNRRSNIPPQFLLIDLDGRQATLFVVHTGQVCLIRSLGLSHDPKHSLEFLSANIQRTLAAAGDILGTAFAPEEIHLTGKGAMTAAFAEDLGRLLAVPVHMVDLVQNSGFAFLEAPVDDWQPLLMNNALAQALCIELGFQGFNFGGRPFTAMKQWLAYKKNFMQIAFLTGAVLVAALVNLLLDFNAMRKQGNALDLRIQSLFRSTLPQVTKIVDPVQQIRAEIKTIQDQSSLAGETERKARAIDILNDISKRIPEQVDVDLTQFVIGPDSVMLTGDTATFNMVDDIKVYLEKSDLFSAVTISSANTDRTGNRVIFKLKIQI